MVCLVLSFRRDGVAEVREAERISLDGNGGILVYDGNGAERLLLETMSHIRIYPVPAQPASRSAEAGR